jgi:hypothetical protein
MNILRFLYSNFRTIIALLLLLILPIVAWTSFLDNYSKTYVNESLDSGAKVYAIARGINAAVSVAKTAHVDATAFEFTPGSALDPIDDLIERFSAILLAALGSLALQKLLLALVSHNIFNVVLTVCAIATAASLLFKADSLYRLLWRSFLVIAFFRFSLGMVAVSNFWVDSTFLFDKDEERSEKMEQFHSELDKENAARLQAQKDLSSHNAKLTSLNSALNEQENALHKIQSELEVEEEEFSDLRTESVTCRVLVSPQTCSDTVIKAKADLDLIRENHDNQEEIVDSIKDAIAELNESIACAESASNGESCGFWDSLSRGPASIHSSVSNIPDKVDAFSKNLISLLMSWLLKTIIIPLLFLYALLKITKVSWSQLPPFLRIDEMLDPKVMNKKSEEKMTPVEPISPEQSKPAN